MIIIFGPAGAGKSVQGQILAARNGWRWLSIGQLLRDTRDVNILNDMREGKLIDNDTVNDIIRDALNKATDIKKVILDGFPRAIEQAKWLIENEHLHGRKLDLIIVIEVPREEIIQRLSLRGRIDDTPEVIDERLDQYYEEVNPILDYFNQQGVQAVRINGVGTVGQVHDRIIEELEKCKLA